MREPQLNTSPSPGDEVKTTTCYMCACRCGIKVWLADGKVRYIQGNPAHPVNQGVLCAKGSAGIMQHYSPARLEKPLLRVGERGSGEFREIEWDEAMQIATSWLAPIRERNPDELAFFTGRDQSQALTGWWAQQFGTINYAAHGGFCSVNMAAGGLYTLGGSFWEFGEPDWEHTQYLMLWGVAEDHDSNPIKLGLGKLKARGAKIVAVNPVRSGYGAIADEWIGIRPGTDGLFAFALIHELLRSDRIDLEYLVRYANAHWLVVRNPGGADDGLFARDAEGHPLCVDRDTDAPVDANTVGISPAVVGEYTLADGRRAVPVFQLLADRYLDPQYSPDAVSERCGVPAATIRRIARELAQAAFDSNLVLPIAWTDSWGREHKEMVGRPVSMHAMRGISAHSNGFHTCRALHVLQMLLGAIDAPGSFRYQPPYPKPIPLPNRPGKTRKPDGSLDAGPLGYVHGPEDLLVDADGNPRRIDHAFSWAYPLSAHGMMHTVLRNAWAGDPYKIDTLMMFMANMSWNSAMNIHQTLQWLTDKDADGEYRIPRIIYSDAYASEMVAYADLVLPDTTYLERFDAISLLDRPISDADGVADAIRHPVLDAASQAPGRDVRGFQSVLLDLGARLGLPGMVHTDGSARFRDYADYIVRHERAPGLGLLAGWRGIEGNEHGKGAPNPGQLDAYIANNGFWREEIPEHARYFKMANRGYLEWAHGFGFVGSTAPIVLQLYSEPLQKFRLAAQGHGPVQPPERDRARVEQYFDPLPLWYEPFEHDQTSRDTYPLNAVTQRPMFMYHAWGSQNAWLRQIATRNFLYLHPDTGARYGIGDDDWIQVSSHLGSIRVQAKFAANTHPDTVWSWNAIGKRKRAWRLAKDAPESTESFLLNHLISDRTPKGDYANADPVTGQAAWFDLRVSLKPVQDNARAGSEPQLPALAFAEADERPLRYGANFRNAQNRSQATPESPRRQTPDKKEGP
ncbi:MAG: molybdopterin oxidoreductase family protein [Luteimonas sp.]